MTIIVQVKKRDLVLFSSSLLFVCFFFGALTTFLFLQLLKFQLVLFKACCFHTWGSFDVYDYQVGIVGFHMTSLKFKLKYYRFYRDFTFTMH